MRKGCLPFFIFTLFALNSSNVLAQTNDDYLKSLEGEASNLTLDKQTQTAPARTSKPDGIGGGWSANQSGDISDLVAGLSVEQFEAVLKSNYIGSYLFYKRLNNDQKDQVYVFYQSNPDPDKVREKILQVSKSL